MKNPAIASRERKIKLSHHCTTGTEQASLQCQTYDFLKQLPSGFLHQLFTPPMRNPFVYDWVIFGIVSLTAPWNPESECKNIRTSKDVGVDMALKGGSVRYPWFSRISWTYLPLFTFMAGTDLSRKRIRKDSAIRSSFFAYRWNANEDRIPCQTCSMPSFCSKLSALDINIQWFRSFLQPMAFDDIG